MTSVQFRVRNETKRLPLGIETLLNPERGLSAKWRHLNKGRRVLTEDDQTPDHRALVEVFQDGGLLRRLQIYEGERRIVEGVGLFIHNEVRRERIR